MAIRDFTPSTLEVMANNLDTNPGSFGDWFEGGFSALGGVFSGNNWLNDDMSNLDGYIKKYFEWWNVGEAEFLVLLDTVKNVEDIYAARFEAGKEVLENTRRQLLSNSIKPADHENQLNEMERLRRERAELAYLEGWYGNPMQLDGKTPEEIEMALLIGRLNNKIRPELKWDQDKIDALWAGCAALYDEYGIQVDPRFMLAIIYHEGTGSFNTSSANKAGDGQNGVEMDFAVDLIRANELVFGKVLGYVAYQEGFKAAVQANNDGTYRYIAGDGDIAQYINWQTPIIRMNGNVDAGVYAGNVYWASDVAETFERFGGDLDIYDEILVNTSTEVLNEIYGDDFTIPEFLFVAEYQTADQQDIYIGNVPNENRYSIIARRVR